MSVSNKQVCYAILSVILLHDARVNEHAYSRHSTVAPRKQKS